MVCCQDLKYAAQQAKMSAHIEYIKTMNTGAGYEVICVSIILTSSSSSSGLKNLDFTKTGGFGNFRNATGLIL
jgi:hypothetical protein